jgi:NAD(P)-dependent dehydrogenase (short-subunit alcohol dehydrogenase family)
VEHFSNKPLEGDDMSDTLFDLTGKVAVVTGASANGGIGHALALGFARYGADIAAADIDLAGAETTGREVEALGRRALVVRCDISKADDVAKLFNRVDEHFGRVDILVNVPFAFPERVPPHQLSHAGWEKTLAVCLNGYFYCAQEAVRRMLKQSTGGSILNIGSIASVSALGRGNFPYSVAKGGIAQMTTELALEYARQGIRANAILPAQVMTPGFRKGMIENPQMGEKAKERYMAGIPIGRMLEPEDFVGPALLLCSAAGAAVTGVLLPVDGGNLAMNAGGSHTWPSD